MNEENGRNATVAQWVLRLEQCGYRVTSQRRAVISILQQCPRLLDVQQLHALACRQYPDLGLVTVHRTVHKLVEIDLALRICRPNGQYAYMAASPMRHMLFCLNCGHITFLNEDFGEFLASLTQRTGYCLDLPAIQLWGVCPKCRSLH